MPLSTVNVTAIVEPAPTLTLVLAVEPITPAARATIVYAPAASRIENRPRSSALTRATVVVPRIAVTEAPAAGRGGHGEPARSTGQLGALSTTPLTDPARDPASADPEPAQPTTAANSDPTTTAAPTTRTAVRRRRPRRGSVPDDNQPPGSGVG